MKHSFIASALLSVYLISTNSFAVDYNWTLTLGGTGYDMAHAAAVDDYGNIYYAGHVAGNVDVNPGPGQDYRNTNNASEDILLTKVRSDGSYLWSRVLGGPSFDRGSSLALDSYGNVYLAGQFSGKVNFNPGGTPDYHTSNNYGADYDIYVTKINANGSYAWTRVLGGSFYVFGKTLDVDRYGHVYVTGTFTGTENFRPEGGSDYRISAGGNDIFITKLYSSGSYAWTKTMGSDGYDMGHSVSIDNNNNIYFVGHFQGKVDLNPTSGVSNFVSKNNSEDVYIMKFSSSGNYQWTKTFGGPAWDGPYNVATDDYGNVYVSGLFSGTSDLNPTYGVTNFVAKGPVDIYVTKLDKWGNFKWARTLGESFNFYYDVTRPGYWDYWGGAFTVNNDGNAYIARCFINTMDFNPTSGVDKRNSNGAADIFLTKINADGSYGWTKTLGGDNDDCANQVATGSNDEVILVGNFQGSMDVNPGYGVDMRYSLGDNDIFIMKFTEYFHHY